MGFHDDYRRPGFTRDDGGGHAGGAGANHHHVRLTMPAPWTLRSLGERRARRGQLPVATAAPVTAAVLSRSRREILLFGAMLRRGDYTSHKAQRHKAQGRQPNLGVNSEHLFLPVVGDQEGL